MFNEVGESVIERGSSTEIVNVLEAHRWYAPPKVIEVAMSIVIRRIIETWYFPMVT
jgi:hypothetical protein